MKVSQATLQNWKRLETDAKTKLQHRANKSRSRKKIFPLEYITGKETAAFAGKVLALSRKNKLSREEVIYTIAVKLLGEKGLLHRPHAEEVLRQFACSADPEIHALPLPEKESDPAGVIYQCLLTEGEKNLSGSYYTPRHIISEMIADFHFSAGENFCDPCCGSGAFLLTVPAADPLQLWGCDKDPIAVFIAKINLICKFPHRDFTPRIFCCDYLKKSSREFFRQTFDFIATNPPWGAEKNIGKKNGLKKEDTFSLFFKKAFSQLKEKGRICFLFPESVLQTKSHSSLRTFILQHALEKIILYPGAFSGVMTGYTAFQVRKAPPAASFELVSGGVNQTVSRESIPEDQLICSFLSPEDREILAQVKSRKNFFLNSRDFALGIVTGDNKNKVQSLCGPGMEKVYTGKEVCRYHLKPAVNFLRYDREAFQQTAREEYYRAPEKLVYKFISPYPVFAYDNTGSLVLNSANILLPHIPGMSIKTVLAFLNSDFLRYYYCLSFSGIKVLKSSLMQLPFPEISPAVDQQIGKLADEGEKAENDLQKLIFACYRLSQEQISVVEKYLRKQDLR